MGSCLHGLGTLSLLSEIVSDQVRWLDGEYYFQEGDILSSEYD